MNILMLKGSNDLFTVSIYIALNPYMLTIYIFVDVEFSSSFTVIYTYQYI